MKLNEKTGEMNGAKQMLLGTSRNNQLYVKVMRVCLILLIMSSLFACSKEDKVNTDENLILEINDEKIPTSEIMVYIYQVVEEFQDIGGEEVWEFEDFSGGKSAIEVAKEAVIENIIRMKVLNDKSVELNISLTEDEQIQVNEQATNYLKNMSEAYIKDNNITLDLMKSLFYEFAISEKVLDHITNDYSPDETAIEQKMLENPEYSRLKEYNTYELLTEIRVSHIMLRTKVKDQSGEYVMLTDEEKTLKYNEAVEILARAKIGEDFSSLMTMFSEETFEEESEENGTYEFSKALLPEQFIDGLVNLKDGEVSEIIESESGYHIFKVNSIQLPTEEDVKSFDENFVLYKDNLRLSVIEELKKDTFNKLYLKWKESVNVSIDKAAWDLISLQI